MQTEHDVSPIAEPIAKLIAIFKENLSTVTFPDITAKTLETLATDVRTHAQELAEATAKAETAAIALKTSQDELLIKSNRALAYAKVFAEGQDELEKQLRSVNLGKISEQKRKKVRRKAVPETGSDASAVEAPKPQAEKKSRRNNPDVSTDTTA